MAPESLWAALSAADAGTWLSVLVKAVGSGAALLAAGGALAFVFLRGLTAADRHALARWTALSALLSAITGLARLPLQASWLTGGGFAGAFDGEMLALAATGPLGDSIAVLLSGLGAIGLALLLRRRIGGRIFGGGALLGAGLVCTSFALRGHALGEPRLILGLLVTLHMASAAFWLGALAPLHRAALTRSPSEAGALAEAFGAAALWVVGALVMCGGVLIALLGGLTPEAQQTAYGQGLAVKLALFAGVMAMAALNNQSLTPALLGGDAAAGPRLARSIRMEAALIAALLLATAIFTSLGGPPTG